jgi:hypothetical protein
MSLHHALSAREGKTGMQSPMNPFALYFDLMRLGWESSVVISLRMMKLAAGGVVAKKEAQLMISEKGEAAVMVALASAWGMASGQSFDTVGRKAVAHYRRKVVANRRRLLRR